jgi:YVTN family beta-propeller protein
MLCLAAGMAAGDTAFVTCQNSDEVSVIDLVAGEEADRWTVPGKPAGVAVHGQSVYTVSPGSKTVRRFQATTGKILARIQLDGGPTGIALDAARGRLYVSDWYAARLWVLDAMSLRVVSTLPTGTSPAGIALSPDGTHVASADKDADQVSIFDAATMTPHATISVGTRPYGLGFSPDGRLFVGNVGSNDVTVIDVAQKSVVGTFAVGERPYAIAFAHGRAFVTNQYANTVSVVRLSDLTHEQTLDVGEYPEGIEATPSGWIVLANWFDNSVNVIDAATLDMIHDIDTCDGPRAFGKFVLGGDHE